LRQNRGSVLGSFAIKLFKPSWGTDIDGGSRLVPGAVAGHGAAGGSLPIESS